MNNPSHPLRSEVDQADASSGRVDPLTSELCRLPPGQPVLGISLPIERLGTLTAIRPAVPSPPGGVARPALRADPGMCWDRALALQTSLLNMRHLTPALSSAPSATLDT